MNISMKSKILYLSTATIFLVLAHIIHSLGALGGDVGSLLYDTKLMLSGGTYVQDFFETNPPMIFYLYTPVVLLAKLSSLSLVTLFKLYVYFLIFFSVSCCVKLLAQIFVNPIDSFIFTGLVLVLFFIQLFLPGHEFGQREHFFMILFFPYLFAAVLRFENKKISPFFAVIIGLMAGLGVGLKPYFLFPIVLIELYFMIGKRSLFAWLRVESLTCIVVLVLYLISIIIFHPQYIHTLLPLISHFYFISTKESWQMIFFRPTVIYCCLVWACYFLFNKHPQRALITILMLALTGMMLAFIVPRSAWYYHVLPALSVSCLLAWIYSSRIIHAQLKNRKLTKIDKIIFILAGCFVFMVPLFYAVVNTEVSILEKNSDNVHSLRSYIQSLPQPQKLYCFSANTTMDCFPLVYDTQSEFAGRFPFFWWLRGVIQIEEERDKNSLPMVIDNDKQFLMNAMIDDLNQYQPTLVIINRYFEDLVLGEQFDYISYFSKNDKFRESWQHYHYVKLIGIYQLYARF